MHIARPPSPPMPTRPLGCVLGAVKRTTAARSVSVPHGAVVLGDLETLQTRPLTLSTTNNRPGHKKECKQVQKALAAAAMAAGGETEAATLGPDSMNPTAAVETCDSATVVPCAPCDHCAVATPALELLVCMGCYQARYCSLACQHGAWLVHCVDCGQLALRFNWNLIMTFLRPTRL